MAETAATNSSVDKASVLESSQLHGLDHPGMILISACLTAYAMVVSVEKQHEVHMELNETVESAAMHVKTNTTPTKQKFDPRASKYVFLGYSQTQKLPAETEHVPLPVPFVDTASESDDVSIISLPLEPPFSLLNRLQHLIHLFFLENHNGRLLNLHGCLTTFAIALHILLHIVRATSFAHAHMSFMAHLFSMQEAKSFLQMDLLTGIRLIWWQRDTPKLRVSIIWISFSPVAKSVTVRVFLAMATSKSWHILQFDVNNAFLHGHLDEEVYMQPLEVYSRAQPGQQHAGTFTALLVYVDDILLAGDSPSQLDAIKAYLDDLFTIKDLAHAKCFLGLELARSQHGLIIAQSKYLQDILLDINMLNARPVSTPFSHGLHLTLDTSSLLPFPDKYRHLVGRILYLSFTRPDISFAVQQLSQFLQHPRSSHRDATLHVLQYLRGSSFLLKVPSLCPHSLMQAELLALILGGPPLVFVSSWVVHSSLERPRSSSWSPDPLLKRNTIAWVLLSMSFFGFPICYEISKFLFNCRFHSGVTTMSLFTSLSIQFFMNAPNTLTSIVICEQRHDEIVWHFGKQGKFSVRSAYILACQLSLDASSSMSSKRGLRLDGGCQLCGCSEKVIMHVLAKCQFARLVWVISGVSWKLVEPNTGDAEAWIQGIHQLAEMSDFELVAAVCWSLWFNRNLKTFEGTSRQAEEVIDTGRRQIRLRDDRRLDDPG
ncbi:UNVERIFIED_CONTAM: Retrovirus-related Pol polyprotein from transposon RE1 [Sesamum latifolium]|uniref:Retrovirus-related Pol polyprotein from transposon RE1 n=1 Tax=Sesamum latifolium TaxID=2727402 RepID=A0AAW2WG14_9LAMI